MTDIYPNNKNENAFEVERDRLHLQMLSAVSHDLKTPLASVIGSLEIFNKMKHVLSDDKKDTLIQTAIQEAYRLDGFISNILDMARLENGMVKVTPRMYSISQIIKETLQKLGEHGKIATIEVVDPDYKIDCHTDITLLSRALQCLVDNALKHSGAKPNIRILYGIKDENVFIHVQDDGPGIHADDHEKIFSKYTRLSKKDYQNASTGLGLTLCRSMIHLLGGQVYVDCPDVVNGSGACFTIQIPYRP